MLQHVSMSVVYCNVYVMKLDGSAQELAHMPILVLAAQLCPPGIEASDVLEK